MENIIHVNINPLITGFGNWAVSWHGFFSFIAVLFAVIFLLATSGRFILPQILQILKIGAPFLTKFIGL